MREAREVKEWTRKESALLSQLEGRAADPKVQQSLQVIIFIKINSFRDVFKMKTLFGVYYKDFRKLN